MKKIKAVGLVALLLRHWHPPRPLSHSPSRSCFLANGRKGDHTRHVGARDSENLRERESEKSRTEERPEIEGDRGGSTGDPTETESTLVDGERCSGGDPNHRDGGDGPRRGSSRGREMVVGKGPREKGRERE